MPQKGEKLSEEQKQKMQEALKKTREKKAAAEQAELEERQAYLAEHGTQAEAEGSETDFEGDGDLGVPDSGPVAATPSKPSEPSPSELPKPQLREGMDYWGPYDDYRIVTTQHGQFAVEPGYQMTFRQVRYFNNRERREMTTMVPLYIWMREGENQGKTRDEIMGLAPGIAEIKLEAAST